MTTIYAHRTGSGSSGTALWSVLVVILIAIAALWFFSHDRHSLRHANIASATISAPLDKRALRNADVKLKAAGTAASSALSKMGTAASSAISETSEDIKAAAARQKAQDAEQAASSTAP